MNEMYLQYILRLVFALFIGGLIGIEREIKGKPAGMRTNMLICMASCLLMILSMEIFRAGLTTMGDPSRIASQVVVGVGFIGAGMIIQSRLSVTGLTSAATVWFVATLGLVIGWGAFLLAAAATVLIIVTLTLLSAVEQMVSVKQQRHILQFRFPTTHKRMTEAKQMFKRHRVAPENLTMRREDGDVLVDLEYTAPEYKHERLVESLRSIDDVEVLLEY